MSPESRDFLLAVLADPTRAGELAPHQAAALLLELTCLQSALAARVAAPALKAEPPAEDRLLTVDDVAARLRKPTGWVYLHRKELGGLKLGHRALRFTERGLKKYLSSRRPL